MAVVRSSCDPGGSGPSAGPGGRASPTPGNTGPGRLNLLLSASGPLAWRDESWAECLPRLLEPMGVRTYRVHSGHEAARLIESTRVHIALVDLGLPLGRAGAGATGTAGAGGGVGVGAGMTPEGGARLLELLARLSSPPPTVVLKPERTAREDARTLCSALGAGAFAVLERPVQLEAVLDVMRRVLRRFYADRWPGDG